MRCHETQAKTSRGWRIYEGGGGDKENYEL